MSRIAVLGAGAWGTALALSLVRQQRHSVLLWGHTPSHVEAMERSRENSRYLPDFRFPEGLRLCSSLQQAAHEADVLLLVTPSEHVRSTVGALATFLNAKHSIVSASKGIEEESFLRVSEIVAALTDVPFAALGGPSFAREVAAALPTAVTLAAQDNSVARGLQQDFSSSSLRVYTNQDVTGVELGGALKNVIALAAGVVAGLELGSNAAAALVTRGMAEITRLAVACGAHPATMAGLAGYGDLVLTCTGTLSRNRSVGVELGRGRSLADVLGGLNGKVAEGVRCTGAALGLAERHSIHLPIASEMYSILHRGRSPREAIDALMTRPARDE